MDRKVFAEKLHEVIRQDQIYTKEQMKQLAEENFEKGDTTANLFIAVEELGELSKEITKAYRTNGDNIYGLIEEMADVKNIIMYLQEVFNISDTEIKAAQTVKWKKLEQWLEENPEGDKNEYGKFKYRL